MRESKLGDLKVRIAGGSDGNGGGDGPLVVLLHGFGAPGDDLVPIARVLGAPREIRYVVPEAPIDLGADYFGGRAWWWIDLASRERARARGQERDLSSGVPKGMPEARETLLAMLADAHRTLGADPATTTLAGFSQGAMLACDAVLRTTLPFHGLVMLSGTFVSEDEWTKLLPARKGLKVLQSHGRSDEMLPIASASRLREAMVAAGLEVEWIPFEGGHEIPPSVLERMRAFVTV